MCVRGAAAGRSVPARGQQARPGPGATDRATAGPRQPGSRTGRRAVHLRIHPGAGRTAGHPPRRAPRTTATEAHGGGAASAASGPAPRDRARPGPADPRHREGRLRAGTGIRALARGQSAVPDLREHLRSLSPAGESRAGGPSAADGPPLTAPAASAPAARSPRGPLPRIRRPPRRPRARRTRRAPGPDGSGPPLDGGASHSPPRD